jgi:hypothetical protein
METDQAGPPVGAGHRLDALRLPALPVGHRLRGHGVTTPGHKPHRDHNG